MTADSSSCRVADGRGWRAAACLIVLMSVGGCAARGARPDEVGEADLRRDAIARARVWTPTRVEAMDVRRGPGGRRAFRPEATVDCTYVPMDLDGKTPKFICQLANGERVKIKYGRDNGEVYAEVAATRLLWALGFGADQVYPVRVRCHGCPPPEDAQSTARAVQIYEVATLERRRTGTPIGDDEGWAWPELDAAPRRGGATVAQRDALKLLAAMLQHTDSKKDQQRIVCDGPVRRGRCGRPFMFIDDLGRTFGRANAFNRDAPSSVNLEAWSDTPVWVEDTGCRANLGRSVTGTLEHPVVSDEGRRMLAGLLSRLREQQLRELFSVARFPQRDDGGEPSDGRTVEPWVRAFRAKVTQIASRSCVERVATR
jgi:hypothetical protein